MKRSPAQLLAQRRRRARQLAMQALYQMQMTGDSPSEIEQWFREEDRLAVADADYFVELLHGVSRHRTELNQLLTPHVERSVETIDPVERALLWVACYELSHRLDVPYRVILNEAIDLAKKFGAEQGHRFVNAVLDKLSPDMRVEERATRPR